MFFWFRVEFNVSVVGYSQVGDKRQSGLVALCRSHARVTSSIRCDQSQCPEWVRGSANDRQYDSVALVG